MWKIKLTKALSAINYCQPCELMHRFLKQKVETSKCVPITANCITIINILQCGKRKAPQNSFLSSTFVEPSQGQNMFQHWPLGGGRAAEIGFFWSQEVQLKMWNESSQKTLPMSNTVSDVMFMLLGIVMMQICILFILGESDYIWVSLGFIVQIIHIF